MPPDDERRSRSRRPLVYRDAVGNGHRRKTLLLSEDQIERLRRAASEKGLTEAEVVRRALDRYLGGGKGRKEK